ncbi:MAG: Mth938-like domain-containing protein [Mariprofundaceae bacterium]|nr:Mth938-like domain-containing protein [Mariprofundaceae bacterium]
MSLGSSFQADISPEPGEGSLLFRGYEDDCFIIGEERYHSGLCFHKRELVEPWGPERLSDLSIEDLAWMMDNPPEILLIGTGRTTVFPDPAILQALAEAHVGFECMDSRAAARTYNILMAEGRDVSAAMLLPNARN